MSNLTSRVQQYSIEKDNVAVKIFSNKEFGDIRTVEVDGEPWFVGKDVARALGYSKPLNALSQHVYNDDSLKQGITDPLGRCQETVLINESGMYSLIFGSKLPSAQKFKRWVTSEVLPSIRKTGNYTRKTDQFELMQQQLDLLRDHDTRLDTLETNMTIDYGQQLTLEKLVKKQVIEALGGKKSNAYKNISKKVFAECNRDVKNHFNVNSRNNIAVIDFDKARQFICNWRPCYTTELLIKDENAQECFV